jgi:hypothetical protein
VQHPAFAQPDVLAARLGERADPRDDLLAGTRERERILLAEQRDEGGDRRPVAVAEAAVAAARAVAADLGLEQRDPELGRTLAQRERRPEAGVAAADDGDVRGRIPFEARRRRRIALRRQRLLEPPRGKPRVDRGLYGEATAGPRSVGSSMIAVCSRTGAPAA